MIQLISAIKRKCLSANTQQQTKKKKPLVMQPKLLPSSSLLMPWSCSQYLKTYFIIISNDLDWSCSQCLKTYFKTISNVLAYFSYKEKMFKCKYLATNQEEVTVGDAARNTLLQILNKLIDSICNSLPTLTFDPLSAPNVSSFQIRNSKSSNC